MRASYDLHGQALVDYWYGGTDAVTILESLDGAMREIPDLLHTCQSLLRPGGILVTNSVPEQPGTVERPSEGYPGNLCFRIRYKDQVGDWVRWLHVDSQRLELAAKDLGWRTEIIYEEPGSDFAALLRPPPQH